MIEKLRELQDARNPSLEMWLEYLELMRDGLPKFLALYDAVALEHSHIDYEPNCSCFRCNGNFEGIEKAMKALAEGRKK